MSNPNEFVKSMLGKAEVTGKWSFYFVLLCFFVQHFNQFNFFKTQLSHLSNSS